MGQVGLFGRMLDGSEAIISRPEEDIPNQGESTLRKRFTEEEDRCLKRLVQKMGLRAWDEVALHMPGRTARQCRDRYNNYLFKNITSQPWTPEEDKIILQKYDEYGPHWVKIAKLLNGRSGNNVKNRWHKFLMKQNQSSGGNPPNQVDSQGNSVIDLGKEIGWEDSSSDPFKCLFSEFED